MIKNISYCEKTAAQLVSHLYSVYAQKSGHKDKALQCLACLEKTGCETRGIKISIKQGKYHDAFQSARQLHQYLQARLPPFNQLRRGSI
jgi:hypothetical protein